MQRCSSYSGEHEYGKCNQGAKLKCYNCGPEHSSVYHGWKVNGIVAEVQRINVAQLISYAEATKVVCKCEDKMA